VSDAEANVLWERRGQVAIVTLNRPELRNAVDAATSSAVAAAMRRLEDDPEVRVGILTGAGSAFSAGADLGALDRGELDGIIGIEGGFCGVVRARRRKPLIAAVNGFALAGGCELALASDIVVAAEEAEFSLPEVRVGIIAGAGGLIRLPQAIGPKKALELILTADRIGAADAERLGLVNHCVPRDAVLDRALEIAGRIAANAPVAIEESMAIVAATVDGTAADGWLQNDASWVRVRATADAVEGPQAFLERRPPRWTGIG
jgi:enoyl-CoA hydratase/carnithine racemase